MAKAKATPGLPPTEKSDNEYYTIEEIKRCRKLKLVRIGIKF